MDINMYSVAGGLAVIGMLALAIRQLTGWPSLKRNSGNNKTQMTKDMASTKTRVGILEKNQTVLFKKVDKIGEDVSFIRGKMERDNDKPRA